MKDIRGALLVSIFLLGAFGLTMAEEAPKAAMEKVAKAAGIDGFDTVKSLSYTFYADLGEKKIARSWTWSPGSNTVTLHGETDEGDVTYQRGKESEKLVEVDQQFVNDLYWLIFPLQVAWDSSVSIEAVPDDAMQVYPDAQAGFRVSYPAGVGYTPGDVYDLFYDENYRVTHWVFRKGGSAEPTRASVWKDFEKFGSLSISLNRTSEDGVRIWFEGVSVELKE